MKITGALNMAISKTRTQIEKNDLQVGDEMISIDFEKEFNEMKHRTKRRKLIKLRNYPYFFWIIGLIFLI